MKTRPRPQKKKPKLVEIVLEMYPDLFFGEMSQKPWKISEKGGSQACFFNVFIYNSKQRVAEGDLTNWHTLISWFKCTYSANGQVIKIQVVPRFF